MGLHRGQPGAVDLSQGATFVMEAENTEMVDLASLMPSSFWPFLQSELMLMKRNYER